jgi:MFS-type transporter involved in bile tolerance (Atg22 family)
MIEVAAYQTLVKKKNVKIFTLIISEINKMLSLIKDSAKLNEMIFVMSLKKLKKKLSIVYHDFLNVFDREKTIQLSSHQSYDHKIELKDENQSSRS